MVEPSLFYCAHSSTPSLRLQQTRTGLRLGGRNQLTERRQESSQEKGAPEALTQRLFVSTTWSYDAALYRGACRPCGLQR